MPTAEAAVRAAESEAAESRGLNSAHVGQTYETTIHADGLPSIRFVSIPGRAVQLVKVETGLRPGMAAKYPRTHPADATELLRILDLAGLESRRFFPAELPWVLWECLTTRRAPSGNRADWSAEDRRLFEFAEYLAFEDLVPFELSAQHSQSLGKLMVGGATMGAALGGAAAGAKVGTAGGLVIGAPAGPLIFITTPVGFVLGGLVGAVTGALGERLFGRLRGSSEA